jgi:oxygen-independent coproporphyrinogen-3 oxidase
LRAVENLRAAGIDNISADIMLGLPGQTARHIETTLKLLLDQNVPHISAYALKLEKGTPLYSAQCSEHFSLRKSVTSCPSKENIPTNKEKSVVDLFSGRFERSENSQSELLNSQFSIVSFPDDDAVADQYDLVCGTLTENGFRRYEVSNFARLGFECRHNLKYWTMGEYWGIGAAAHSFYGGARYANSRSLNYRTRKTPQTPADDLNDTIMLGLRTARGIDAAALKQAYGRDLLSEPIALDLIRRGFLVLSGPRLAVAPDKFYVMNSIITKLIL